MKNRTARIASEALGLFFSISLAMADTHYVDVNGRKPAPPYGSWKTAATDLRTTLEAAHPGDTVMLADGVYVVDSPVKVSKRLTIESRNGRDFTTVTANGACRVFALSADSGLIELRGLTITGGYMGVKGGVGGGVVVHGDGPIRITGCRIEDNEAIKHGGGIHFCLKPGTTIQATISDCLIQNNRAGVHGGGVHATMWGDVSGLIRIEDCVINQNQAGGEGGGIRCSATNGLVVLERCLVSNNVADRGGGVLLGRSTLIANSLIYRNEALTGDGGGIRSGGNGGGGHGGGGHDDGGHDDGGHDDGGHDDGGHDDGGHDDGGNDDGHDGGHDDGGSGKGSGGKGLGGAGSGGVIINCTITENRAASSGGGVINPYVYNSIVCGNFSPIDSDIGASSEVANSCASHLVAGANGNINAPPKFINAQAGDFRLLATSPCIDAGANDWMANTLDLGRHSRRTDGDQDQSAVVDMGAYEFQGIVFEVRMVPHSDVNAVTLNSLGLLKVAILSAHSRDPLQIDPASVRFRLAAPKFTTQRDLNRDGMDDLVLYFNKSHLEDPSDGHDAFLFGQLFDGRWVMGEAALTIQEKR